MKEDGLHLIPLTDTLIKSNILILRVDMENMLQSTRTLGVSHGLLSSPQPQVDWFHFIEKLILGSLNL